MNYERGSSQNDKEGRDSDFEIVKPRIANLIARVAIELSNLQAKITERNRAMGALAIAGMPDHWHDDDKFSNVMLARGGNFAVVRDNLFKAGKANSKQPMSDKQKKLRRRKRKKKR